MAFFKAFWHRWKNGQATGADAAFWLLLVFSLTPWASPAVALLLGIVLAQTLGHPYAADNKKVSGLLLKASVVGLGFGMNLFNALQAGKEGFVFTVVSITGTLVLGAVLARLFGVDKKTAQLVSSGTAICGGSAIAAVAPVLKADEKQISVALGIVFVLNALALFVFPPIGNWLALSQEQFGLWSAIAIHDTSSVVGAAARYGEEALTVATTVKLMRALWIIPLALFFSMLERGKGGGVSIPWFIGLFVLAMVLNTYVPYIDEVSPYLVAVSKAGLRGSLFLIGAGLSKKNLRSVGVKPMVLGVLLWLAIGSVSLGVILNF